MVQVYDNLGFEDFLSSKVWFGLHVYVALLFFMKQLYLILFLLDTIVLALVFTWLLRLFYTGQDLHQLIAGCSCLIGCIVLMAFLLIRYLK
ncbi:hypothetical protein FPE01S_01_00760 [Flavihumibacter petaseus NBRC 106054]|uniref:Uncharacterized protein n=2 Tax=Flavihumibacter TaxID=1004301 RepID=A0A0E9MU18_9BACT|nr:hypothetical protein FPE01S_01_00760 [Flavihumibacter petaseus NBRC 106054]